MDEFRTLRRIASQLEGFAGRWGFCGGWGIDLFVGSVGREHDDVDIALLRRDQLDLRACMVTCGWTWEKVQDHELQPWPEGDFLELPVHELWAERSGHQPRRLEFLLNEADGDEFRFRRNPEITCPLADAFCTTVTGLPVLAPEIVLLYKAGSTDEKHHIDFRRTLPHLSRPRRDWLGEALLEIDLNHPWIDSL